MRGILVPITALVGLARVQSGAPRVFDGGLSDATACPFLTFVSTRSRRGLIGHSWAVETLEPVAAASHRLLALERAKAKVKGKEKGERVLEAAVFFSNPLSVFFGKQAAFCRFLSFESTGTTR